MMRGFHANSYGWELLKTNQVERAQSFNTKNLSSFSRGNERNILCQWLTVWQDEQDQLNSGCQIKT